MGFRATRRTQRIAGYQADSTRDSGRHAWLRGQSKANRPSVARQATLARESTSTWPRASGACEWEPRCSERDQNMDRYSAGTRRQKAGRCAGTPMTQDARDTAVALPFRLVATSA